jgi:uncharacterized repeat protein (TIGR04042 family)
MPEMRFRIRWPDGETETCFSPSLVVKEHFKVGETYELRDFCARSRAALTIGSERVKARYGYPCSLALRQLARIEARVASFGNRPKARVAIDAFEE